MAKYEEIFEDVQIIFDSIMIDANLDQVANIKILADDKQKVIGKVSKSNELTKHIAGVDAVIIINQRIFEGLTAEQQDIQARELTACLYWNDGKDKLEIDKPDVNTFSLLLRKYGYDKYEVLSESIKSLYIQAKEEDDIAKG